MITAHMLEFIRMGSFDRLRLGLTRAQVEQICGQPDTMGGTSLRYPVPCIWKYGDIEVHFDQNRDQATMLCLGNFTVPCGGSTIALDPWVVRGGLSRPEFEEALRNADISFSPIDTSWSQGMVTAIEVLTGARFWFREIMAGSDEQPGLYAVSIEDHQIANSQ